MTFQHLDAAALGRIVDEFSRAEWPMPPRALDEIATRLGWTVLTSREKGADYLTGLADRTRASAQFNDGNVGQVAIDATTRVEPGEPAQQGELAEAYASLCGGVEAGLGEPARKSRGEFPRQAWDLANGGRIVVSRLGAKAVVIVLQKKYADIERFEESRGVPDDRDPSADLD